MSAQPIHDPATLRCPICKGTGLLNGKQCPLCDGKGIIRDHPLRNALRRSCQEKTPLASPLLWFLTVIIDVGDVLIAVSRDVVHQELRIKYARRTVRELNDGHAVASVRATNFYF